MPIQYGKLSSSDEKKINFNNDILKFLNKVGGLKDLENIPFPSDEETKDEIDYLKDRMNNISDEEYDFAKKAEKDEQGMYVDFANNVLGLNIEKSFIKKIFDKTNPVLFYLKKHYNRGRPNQYANAFGIDFDVPIDHSAHHPAYPSGHAFDSYLMEHIFSKMNPDKKQEIQDFTKKMRESRLDVGLHFPSDNFISKVLAQKVINTGLL